jgi:rod shape-determining protein MreC
MKELFKFFAKNSFFFIFIFLEGLSILLIVRYNSFQKSSLVNTSRSFSGYFYSNMQFSRQYFNLRTINEKLVEENLSLKNEIEAYYKIEKEDTATVITFSESNYEYLSARVINNSISRQYNMITLDAGSNEGLKRDMAVVTGDGVVGIVTGVSNNFATVLPVINRNFRVSAKISKNNYFGIAEWDGINYQYIKLKEIPLHVDVSVGDTIVTSGHSTVFPSGILIGEIAEVKAGDSNFFDIKVKLSNDFGNLYYVSVIKNKLQQEQLELEKLELEGQL